MESHTWRTGYRTAGVTIVLVGLLLGSAGPAASLAIESGAVFDITWSPGCQTPPTQAVAALEYAAGLWGTWISSTVPIEVSVCWTPDLSGGDALATGMPSRYVYNFPGAPLVNTAYPIALANALGGSDLDPARADMMLQFKSDIGWSFALTPTRLAGQAAGEDFVAVALHELAHGLGFIGNMYESYNVGFCGDGPYGFLYPCPTPYDWFAVDSTGVPLLDYHTSNPIALGTRLEGDASFGGPNTVIANAGAAARLYTPMNWQPGSSLSHLDQGTFGSGVNRLMTPSYSGVTRHPGAVTLGIMQDMGWLRADGVPNAVTSGPLVVGAGQVAAFTGKLAWSGYTGQPITFTWTAADQITATHPGLTATDNITFTWNTPGEKRITLAATDGAVSAAATRALLVYDVTASGPAQGDTNHAYTFNAAILPAITSFPITYTWEATDKAPIVHAGRYQTYDSAAFTWITPGAKTITVTAAIAGAVAQATRAIHIEGIVFDRFIFLPLVLRGTG